MERQTKGVFQKVLAGVLLAAIPLFVIANFSVLRSKRDLSCDFYSDFIPQEEYLTQKTFVFVIYSNQDETLSEQNITSIFHQKYDNYRVVILQGGQNEESIQKLRTIAAKENKAHLLTIMKSPTRKLTVDTFRRAIEECKDDEIVIQIEGKDWLAHENVLEKLNEIYSNSSEVWLAYSQYLEYPSYRKGGEQPYLKKMLRDRYSKKIPWLSAHFKTYYAGLFKQIKPDAKFTYKRSLVSDSLDLFMLPMVESSKNHIRFINDVLFIHSLAPSQKHGKKSNSIATK